MHSISKFLSQAALIAASAVTTFRAWAAGPAMPPGTSPGTVASPGPVQASSSVRLQWGAVSNITYYGVGVRDLVTNSLVVSTTTTTPSYAVSLVPGRPYRWNVAACNASGCSAYTTALYFQTPAPAKTLSSVAVLCPSSLNEGTSGNCSATARFSDNTTQVVTTSAAWSENSTATTISSAGVLTAGQVTANQAATVTASYTYSGLSRSGSASVTVVDNGSGNATPAVVFGSNPTQYQRLTAQVTWGPGTIPTTAVMALNDADLLTSSTTGRTATAVFMPQLAGVKSWVLKSRSGTDGPVLASGTVSVAIAPAFEVRPDSPAYAANPGGRGYCRPQCAEFVQAQLGLPGGRGYAKNFWTNPYTAEGYVNQAQGQSTRPPRPGDMLVWSGALNATVPLCVEANGCGHVAIVKSVDLASGTLVRVDANWAGTCALRETTMTLTRDPTSGSYTIGGTNSNHLLGWQSKN